MLNGSQPSISHITSSYKRNSIENNLYKTSKIKITNVVKYIMYQYFYKSWNLK